MSKLPEGWEVKHEGRWWRGVNDLPCVIRASPRRYFAYELGWRIGTDGEPPFDKSVCTKLIDALTAALKEQEG